MHNLCVCFRPCLYEHVPPYARCVKVMLDKTHEVWCWLVRGSVTSVIMCFLGGPGGGGVVKQDSRQCWQINVTSPQSLMN